MSSIHAITVKTITGKDASIGDFAGNVLLVVNVASECGLTPQYSGLEELHSKYPELCVLGFPCNQFGSQEPGTEEQILDFCQTRYDVSFPLFAKIEVNGDGRHPLYTALTDETAAFPGKITWNFEKFLIARDGTLLARFEPKTTPDDPALIAAIEDALS